jgi:hypothetical protein
MTDITAYPGESCDRKCHHDGVFCFRNQINRKNKAKLPNHSTINSQASLVDKKDGDGIRLVPVPHECDIIESGADDRKRKVASWITSGFMMKRLHCIIKKASSRNS